MFSRIKILQRLGHSRGAGRGSGHKLLITDGVFSMDGDIAPLPALVDIAERHGAIMMIDDAHSSGVLGRNGRGTMDHFDCMGAWMSRWARCRRPSACSADMCAAAAT